MSAVVDPDGLLYYQRETVNAVLEELQTVRSTLLVLATGLGKTQVAGGLCNAWKGTILFLAHRDELIEQARARLEQMCAERVDVEKAEQTSYGTTRLVVASVQSMNKRRLEGSFERDRFTLIITDECFPAGTLVDGRPIEDVCAGDFVYCVNHRYGGLERRRVVRTFSKIVAEPLVVLHSGVTEITCTGEHPVFVQRGEHCGYIEANRVRRGDMLCVRQELPQTSSIGPARPENMLQSVRREALISADGGDQPRLRERAHDDSKPDANHGVSREVSGDPPADGAQAAGSRWERTGAGAGRSSDAFGTWSWLEGAPRNPNEGPEGERLPDELQGGHRSPGADGRCRGGWIEPPGAGAQGAGREEGRALAWSRVDRVSRVEPAGPRGTRVYNLEVEGSHTYFANGALVHNCHHATAASYRRVYDYFPEAKHVGLTATPDRTDGKALGMVFSSVAFEMGIEDGIDAGYLVPLEAQSIDLKELDISDVTKTGKDLNAGQLDEKMLEQVEPIVHGVAKYGAGRRGIVFMPGVKSAALGCERMNALEPESSRFVSGDTEDDERACIMNDFRNGRFRWLWNCMIATEGFDAPAADCVVLGRPTLSRALVAQMVGRGTRPHPSAGVYRLPGREQAGERRAAIDWSEKPSTLVLDFNVMNGKHSLMTPLDALAGTYTEAEVALAKKKKSSNPLEALRQARAEIRAMAKAIESKAKLDAQRYDPFSALSVNKDRLAAQEQMYGRMPPSPSQVYAMRLRGIPDRDINGMSKLASSRVLAADHQRELDGLATYAQMRVLQRWGVTGKVTAEGARAALDHLQQKWGFPSGINAAEIQRIAVGWKHG